MSPGGIHQIQPQINWDLIPRISGTGTFPKRLGAGGERRENPGIPTIPGFSWMGFCTDPAEPGSCQGDLSGNQISPVWIGLVILVGLEFQLFPKPLKVNSMKMPKKCPQDPLLFRKKHQDRVLESSIPQHLKIRD